MVAHPAPTGGMRSDRVAAEDLRDPLTSWHPSPPCAPVALAVAASLIWLHCKQELMRERSVGGAHV